MDSGNTSEAFDFNAYQVLLRKKARIQALIGGSAVVLCLIFFMFAFIQKAAADKAKASAEMQKRVAEEMQMKVLAAEQLAIEQMQASQKHIEALEQQLNACQKR
jgi:hypothetical protein